MIETIVLEHLSNLLNVPCYMEVPEDPVGRYVVVEKTGASVEDYISRASIAVQSYADSLYDAAVLSETVRKAMESIITHEMVFRCSLNAEYNHTDTRTKRYRYQALFNLTFKEA